MIFEKEYIMCKRAKILFIRLFVCCGDVADGVCTLIFAFFFFFNTSNPEISVFLQ